MNVVTRAPTLKSCLHSRTVAAIVFLSISCPTTGQVPTGPYSPPAVPTKEPVKKLVATPRKGKAPVGKPVPWKYVPLHSHVIRLKWPLAFVHNSAEYRPARGEDVIAQIAELPMSNEYRASLAGYEPAVDEALRTLSHAGGHDLFFLSGTEAPPLLIAEREGKRTLVLDVSIGSSLNTVKMSPKQRAALVVSSVVLPVLKDLSRAFAKTNVQELAVFVVYGSKNFLKDESAESELVGMVVGVDAFKRFDRAETTDQGLVDSAITLLSDRDGSPTPSRVKLVLE